MIKDPSRARLGRFFLPWAIINDDKALAELAFNGMIVLSAEHRYDLNAIEYLGLHDQFEIVVLGNLAPTYEAVIDTTPHHRELTWRVQTSPLKSI